MSILKPQDLFPIETLGDRALILEPSGELTISNIPMHGIEDKLYEQTYRDNEIQYRLSLVFYHSASQATNIITLLIKPSLIWNTRFVSRTQLENLPDTKFDHWKFARVSITEYDLTGKPTTITIRDIPQSRFSNVFSNLEKLSPDAVKGKVKKEIVRNRKPKPCRMHEVPTKLSALLDSFEL